MQCCRVDLRSSLFKAFKKCFDGNLVGSDFQVADSDEVAWAIRDDLARDSEMISPGCGASLA
jgi:hypothetical protein